MPTKDQLICTPHPFGVLPSGEAITQYHLRNKNGVSAKIINYGATLTSLIIPGEKNTDIVLGFDTLEEYLKHEFYFGCTIGRVANRITHGRFTYQNKTYQLACNDKQPHHLHGGCKGFDKVVWRGEAFAAENAVGVRFYYLSRDGEEGYPGNLDVVTTYTLTNDNELKIAFQAQTDQATPIDLTNHTYWNLAGVGNILAHQLQVFAERYVVTDQHHIPSGAIQTLHNTPLDFTHLTPIGARIAQVAGGYDLFYILPNPDKTLRLAAQVIEPATQRQLDVYTTQPGLQFYTGNYLYPYPVAHHKKIAQYAGLCLETQNFPGAVNHANFPSPFLLPEEIYQHETIYKLRGDALIE
jgi:aldose 1-epimerase